MKLDRIDTIRLDDYPNLLYVRLETDDGLAGQGETMFGPRTVEAYLHETVAPAILGRDVEPVEALSDGLEGYVGFASSGAETRGNSAVDTALGTCSPARATCRSTSCWAGEPPGHPVTTCAGRTTCVAGRRWRPQLGIPERQEPRYEDLDAFLHRAADEPLSLLGEKSGR
jgi:hypothetical protein